MHELSNDNAPQVGRLLHKIIIANHEYWFAVSVQAQRKRLNGKEESALNPTMVQHTIQRILHFYLTLSAKP